jgi:hypothetical protein
MPTSLNVREPGKPLAAKEGLEEAAGGSPMDGSYAGERTVGCDRRHTRVGSFCRLRGSTGETEKNSKV